MKQPKDPVPHSLALVATRVNEFVATSVSEWKTAALGKAFGFTRTLLLPGRRAAVFLPLLIAPLISAETIGTVPVGSIDFAGRLARDHWQLFGPEKKME